MGLRVTSGVKKLAAAIFVILALAVLTPLSAQLISPQQRNFRVEGGTIKDKQQPSRIDSMRSTVFSAADSLQASNLGITLPELDSIRITQRLDSILVAEAELLRLDTLAADSMGLTLEEYYTYQDLTDSTGIRTPTLGVDMTGELTKRELRRQQRLEWKADTTLYRHNKIFKDSIPISRVTAISLVVPGFAQLYNDQAWKIPILYGTVGTATYFWLQENKKYKRIEKEYNYLLANVDRNSGNYNTEIYPNVIEPVQERMIKQNTKQQLLMFAAFGSYFYFVGDGVANYPGATTSVKKATTLSTIIPGAGQIYNGSYWKAPIVLGGFATMAFVIDWNNRGYKRYKTAYEIKYAHEQLVASGAPNPGTSNDEFNGRISSGSLKNAKNSFRRNRDLCIILTGAFYLLNVVDAHVDAHMKDYDISDDLAFNVVPSITNISLASGRGNANLFGLSFQLTF